MNITSSLKKPGNRLFICLILCFSLLAAPFVNAAEMRPSEKIRVKFSEAVEKSVVKTAAALDKTVRKLALAIDQTLLCIFQRQCAFSRQTAMEHR